MTVPSKTSIFIATTLLLLVTSSTALARDQHLQQHQIPTKFSLIDEKSISHEVSLTTPNNNQLEETRVRRSSIMSRLRTFSPMDYFASLFSANAAVKLFFRTSSTQLKQGISLIKDDMSDVYDVYVFTLPSFLEVIPLVKPINDFLKGYLNVKTWFLKVWEDKSDDIVQKMSRASALLFLPLALFLSRLFNQTAHSFLQSTLMLDSPLGAFFVSYMAFWLVTGLMSGFGAVTPYIYVPIVSLSMWGARVLQLWSGSLFGVNIYQTVVSYVTEAWQEFLSLLRYAVFEDANRIRMYGTQRAVSSMLSTVNTVLAVLNFLKVTKMTNFIGKIVGKIYNIWNGKKYLRFGESGTRFAVTKSILDVVFDLKDSSEAKVNSLVSDIPQEVTIGAYIRDHIPPHIG